MEHQPIDKYKVELKEVSLENEGGFKKINCPSCGNHAPANNININDKIAKCSTCDVVFPFEKEIKNLISPQRIKQEVIRPEGIDIFRFRNELDISIQQPMGSFELLTMSIATLIAVISINVFSAGNMGLMGLLFSLFITSLPFLSLFFRSKYKIHVAIDNKYLYIEWRPKKLKKDKRYDIKDIHQIYTKTTKSDGFKHQVYMIVNGENGQKHILLIHNVGSLSKARYLEQEIEKQLGITDRQVPEESI